MELNSGGLKMARILLVIMNGVSSKHMVLSTDLIIYSPGIYIFKIVYKLFRLFAYINLSSFSFWYKTWLVYSHKYCSWSLGLITGNKKYTFINLNLHLVNVFAWSTTVSPPDDFWLWYITLVFWLGVRALAETKRTSVGLSCVFTGT